MTSRSAPGRTGRGNGNDFPQLTTADPQDPQAENDPPPTILALAENPMIAIMSQTAGLLPQTNPKLSGYPTPLLRNLTYDAVLYFQEKYLDYQTRAGPLLPLAQQGFGYVHCPNPGEFIRPTDRELIAISINSQPFRLDEPPITAADIMVLPAADCFDAICTLFHSKISSIEDFLHQFNDISPITPNTTEQELIVVTKKWRSRAEFLNNCPYRPDTKVLIRFFLKSIHNAVLSHQLTNTLGAGTTCSSHSTHHQCNCSINNWSQPSKSHLWHND
jgi:hypothetical protein